MNGIEKLRIAIAEAEQDPKLRATIAVRSRAKPFNEEFHPSRFTVQLVL